MSYRYPAGTIFRDYVRAATGVSLFFVPVMAFDLPRVTIYLCIAIGTLFVFYLRQTVIRHRTRIDMDDRMIRNRASELCFAWDELSRVALRYFSLRRDRDAGWLELRISSGNRSLCLDSRIEGFERIAAQAARAAAENGLPLDGATLSNLDALGIQHSKCTQQRD
jgi:hypothetical protein